MISVITLMGVSGCGKTTVARELADELGWQFIESDAYHSEADIQKMSSGTPLTDEDRLPWLQSLNHALRSNLKEGKQTVLACSALKKKYRDILYTSINPGVYVFLKGDFGLIWERMQQREHFMRPEMLQSQFDDLEEPSDALTIDIELPVPEIVRRICDAFSLKD
jgi:gluconokinase